MAITEEMADKIFDDYHNQKEEAHFGYDKTYSTIRRKYYMTGLPGVIQRKCSECRECCYYKAAKEVYRDPQIKGAAKYPLDKIKLDAMRPIPRSTHGKKFVIVAVDSLTQNTMAKATVSQETSEIIRFINELTAMYGLPKCVQTDQGTNFMSFEFADYVVEHNIIHITGDVYHHQWQGMVERMNRALGERIKLFCSEKKTSKWDEELDRLILGINFAPHKVTRYTPFYHMHGYHARRKVDNELKTGEVLGNLSRDREIARERLEKAQEVYTRLMKQARHANYYTGQLVLVERKAPDLERGKKLAQKWTGSFMVLKYINGRVTVIPLEKGLAELTYNVD